VRARNSFYYDNIIVIIIIIIIVTAVTSYSVQRRKAPYVRIVYNNTVYVRDIIIL